MKSRDVEELLPGLYRFTDTCNVYVVCSSDDAIAIDFGSGAWLKRYRAMGLPRLSRVYLTHVHADQCSGLERLKRRGFEVWAPEGEKAFIEPRGVKQYWNGRGGPMWFPPAYEVLKRGVAGVKYHAGSFSDCYWGTRRIRFVKTPGHGRSAISIVLDHVGKQLVFCGDAAHAGATVVNPYCLEWDHWTGEGAQAALEGVRTIGSLGMDMLCPAHGPVIRDRPRAMLARLVKKLGALVEVKGSICAGEKDHYVEPIQMRDGMIEVLPGLWNQFNAYLLCGDRGEAMLVDPSGDDRLTDRLIRTAGSPKVTMLTATHFHADHTDGLNRARERFGAKVALHPRVASALAKGRRVDRPYCPFDAVKPDIRLPATGTWQWNQYRFKVAPFGGQTWWHAASMTTIDGRKVMFGGDSFQPASRWNGTGGFSSINGSRFKEGFTRSAELVLRWRPEVLVNGHSTFMHYHASHFRRIIRWAERAEQAVRELCPSGNLNKDYYLHGKDAS